MSLRQTRNKSTQSSNVAMRVADIYEFLPFPEVLNSINSLPSHPSTGIRTGPKTQHSVPAKIRLALLEKRVQAFQTVFGLEAVNLQSNFLVQRGCQIDAIIACHGV